MSHRLRDTHAWGGIGYIKVTSLTGYCGRVMSGCGSAGATWQGSSSQGHARLGQQVVHII